MRSYVTFSSDARIWFPRSTLYYFGAVEVFIGLLYIRFTVCMHQYLELEKAAFAYLLQSFSFPYNLLFVLLYSRFVEILVPLFSFRCCRSVFSSLFWQKRNLPCHPRSRTMTMFTSVERYFSLLSNVSTRSFSTDIQTEYRTADKSFIISLPSVTR